MVKNKYVDTSIQKGGILGFTGCLEHVGVLNQLIQKAKETKGNLTVVWIDLVNAYGSIPHDLINVAIEHYHIPHHVRDMVTWDMGKYMSPYTLMDSKYMVTLGYGKVHILWDMGKYMSPCTLMDSSYGSRLPTLQPSGRTWKRES